MARYEMLIAASGKHGSALLPYVLVDDISSPKAGGNIVISTRRMFTTTVLILLWLGGCLCRRRR